MDDPINLQTSQRENPTLTNQLSTKAMSYKDGKSDDNESVLNVGIIPQKDNSELIGLASINGKQTYTRRDQNGNQIKPGQKRHKVTFVDQVQKKPISDIYIVESYKKYNAEESPSTSTSCCSIY